MNKFEFDKFLLKKLKGLDEIRICIRIWNGFNDENESASWLDVYFDMDNFPNIYTSEYYKDSEKEDLVREQKKWHKKISIWLKNYNSNYIDILVDEHNI